ncbi:hypothetical protein [Marinobacter sp.]|uniref:hypothetical protein n=1 Tax=Marinobacter sp. TaxID=50741 RepID=UPI000C96F55F|nr:hypothetical protein [Marinobacter sp.]MAB53553.1 hypothetical protein [Marinobacter sp.]
MPRGMTAGELWRALSRVDPNLLVNIYDEVRGDTAMMGVADVDTQTGGGMDVHLIPVGELPDAFLAERLWCAEQAERALSDLQEGVSGCDVSDALHKSLESGDDYVSPETP